MKKYLDTDKFVEWHSNALRDYLSKQWPTDTDHHILDLAVAAASFSESFYVIIENMPD